MNLYQMEKKYVYDWHKKSYIHPIKWMNNYINTTTLISYCYIGNYRVIFDTDIQFSFP